MKIDDGNNARAAEVVMAALIEACVPLDDGEAGFMRGLSDVRAEATGTASRSARCAPVRHCAAPRHGSVQPQLDAPRHLAPLLGVGRQLSGGLGRLLPTTT